jgi:TRAP-type C4-dicarboxylate transport system permease small subunit
MKAWSRLMQACGAASATILGLVTMAVVWDVLARNLGARSLPWIVEATEYALPLATFLAAPWLMFRYEHVRLDLLATTLSKPALMRVERVTAAICMVVSLTIAWYAVRVILDTKQIGALVIKSLIFPEWWLFLPVPVCFVLLALECARRLVFPPPPTGSISEAGLPVPGEAADAVESAR